jgi:hypothetical protein
VYVTPDGKLRVESPTEPEKPSIFDSESVVDALPASGLDSDAGVATTAKSCTKTDALPWSELQEAVTV